MTPPPTLQRHTTPTKTKQKKNTRTNMVEVKQYKASLGHSGRFILNENFMSQLSKFCTLVLAHGVFVYLVIFY